MIGLSVSVDRGGIVESLDASHPFRNTGAKIGILVKPHMTVMK